MLEQPALGTPRATLDNLSDPQIFRKLAYINGCWVGQGNGSCINVLNPATGDSLAQVPDLGSADVRSAIEVASRAFAEWNGLLPQKRSAILRKWCELTLSAKDDLALVMTLEQGKPLQESLGEIEYAASFIEWYAEEGKRINAESVTSHLAGAEMIVRREALGVVGVVTPWNFPSAMLTRKAAAALAAGCTVVAHPSSQTPLSALALAELGGRAGLPAGVFNIVTGHASTVVSTMCDDTRVRAISFTGSTEIGRVIAEKCAPTMKRLVMELGGHAPLIVFSDANIDRAVDIAMGAKFATSGQDCLAANRIYVQRALYSRFCAVFADRIKDLKVGNGLVADTEIGPLINSRAVAKVEQHVADALACGSKLLVGGERDPAGALFYKPTLLIDVPDKALIMRDETFGPVAAVTPFDDEDEVVCRANDTEYGLVAYVVTENGARQFRMGRQLEYGMVAINRVRITGAPIPFGGSKQSGVGREGSRHGLEAFTELKYVCIDTAV